MRHVVCVGGKGWVECFSTRSESPGRQAGAAELHTPQKLCCAGGKVCVTCECVCVLHCRRPMKRRTLTPSWRHSLCHILSRLSNDTHVWCLCVRVWCLCVLYYCRRLMKRRTPTPLWRRTSSTRGRPSSTSARATTTSSTSCAAPSTPP
jgi:hypothetical protein